MKRIAAVLAVLAFALPVFAEEPVIVGPIHFDVGSDTFIVPFKVVAGVQLYSPELGKGFPGLETVLARRKSWKLSVGAAPILGTSANVPFVSLSTRLSPRFFDISGNDLYFGAWAGKPSDGQHVIFGLSASTALW